MCYYNSRQFGLLQFTITWLLNFRRQLAVILVYERYYNLRRLLLQFTTEQSGPQPDLMTSPTFAKWRPRRETQGKVTSRLFAAPRSVFPRHYFESCVLRQ